MIRIALPRRIPRLSFTLILCLCLGAVLCCAAFGCDGGSQRSPIDEGGERVELPVGDEGSGGPTGEVSVALPVGLIADVSDVVCAAYSAWPIVDWVSLEGQVSGLASGLDVSQRALFSETAIAAAASLRCPDVLPADSLAQGRLPIGAPDIFTAEQGFFDPVRERLDTEEERARLEWTAVGLGCLGLWQGPDERLGELERAFLEQMGFTRATYIEASLALSLPEMSERIFGAIVRCAERAGVDQPE